MTLWLGSMMLNWFPLALLSAFILTFINYGDKYVVERQIPDPLALIIFLSWVNLCFALVLWLLVGLPILPLRDTLLLFIAGTPPAFAGFFYFQVVSRDEISRVVVLLQLTPVFTLLLSVMFLGDALTLQQLLGFSLIMAAAIGVTRQPPPATPSELEAPATSILLLMILTTLIFAGGFVLSDDLAGRLATDLRGLTTITAYTSFGYWLGGLVLMGLLPNVRRAFNQQRKVLTGQAVASIIALESLFITRQFVLFQALVLGPVALVTLIGSLNVFFAIFLGWALTLWRPQIFKENISRASLLRKGAWALVVLVGLILINLA